MLHIAAFASTQPVLPWLSSSPVKDCNPADGPPCSQTEHKDLSIPIYDTLEKCCDRLNWIDIDVCTSFSEGRSRGFFADPSSGSCLQECDPGASDCASSVPPPLNLYDSIDACCSEGQWWVEYKYCTSRSVGEYSEGWLVDFQNEKCGMSCCLYRALHRARLLNTCKLTHEHFWPYTSQGL